MLKKKTLGIIPLLLFFIFISQCNPFKNMAIGDKAIEKMSTEEKTFLESKLLKITKDMSEQEVTAILGEAYRGAGTMRPAWLAPGNDPKSQVVVYFLNDKVKKVRWLKLGYFMWKAKL